MSVDHRARRQRGSLLLEFTVAALLSLMLAVWASHEWAQRTRVLQARSLAVWMGVAQDAVQAFLAQHAAMLANASTHDALAGLGIADWMAPRWEELRAAGFLASGWQPGGPLRRTLGLSVLREGVCPGPSCHVWALVYAQPALRTNAGGVDEALVAEWLQAAGGHGLVIWPHQPGFLGGAGLRMPVPGTDAGHWVPGVVALAVRAPSGTRSESVTEGDADYLRVGDVRDPDFQGDATVQGRIRSGTRLAARDSLELEHGWGVGEACTPEGALGRVRDGLGVVTCQQGFWALLARPAGGG
jgi:hypothetical protein